MKSRPSTSWQNVNKWYNKSVGSEGHYYHEHVVIPGTLKLLDFKHDSRVLDLGCGQGVLARAMPEVAEYVGIDNSPSLIAEAQRTSPHEHYVFQCLDVTKGLKHLEPKYTHAVFVLSLQNMRDAAAAATAAAASLIPGGTLLLILNHPCFRIPRQSGWGIDDKTKQQYRWINRYLSPLEIPISMNPSQQTNSKVTWSFHHSLQDYSSMLTSNGLSITAIEEWTSDKQSEGRNAKMEDRARSEFPLFLAIQARK